MEIRTDEVFGMDWDWFASDIDGNTGHFTTAGMRPESMRRDKEGLDRLADYFQRHALVRGKPLLTPGLEKDRSAFKKRVNCSSFLEMASRVLYSYNTELIYGQEAK